MNTHTGGFIAYPLPMNLALAGLSYGITLVALVLLAVRTKKLIGIYKKGQPDPTRSNDKGTAPTYGSW